MLELREERPCRTILQSGPILRTASGKLPSLSGKSLPHGGRRPVKAQDDKLTVPSLAVNSGVSYRIRGVIGAVGVDFVIDTGAAVSLVRRDVWEQIVKGDCTLVLEQWAGRRLVGVNGAPLSVSGCKKVDIFLNGMPFKVMCVVTDDIMVEAILGLDFVNAHNGIIDCGSKRLTFPSRNISVPLQMQSCPLQQNPIGLIVKEKIVIPAASEVELMVDLATPVAKGTWVVAGNTSARHGVMVAHAVVCPNAKPVPVRVVNPREEIVVLKKGTEIAHMELLEQDPVIEISTVAEKFNISREDQSLLWEMVSRVGDDVNKDEKEELFSLRCCWNLQMFSHSAPRT